jgi:hypothetical protein
MEIIIEKILTTDNLGLLVITTFLLYFMRKVAKLEETVQDLTNQQSKTNLEVGILRGKAELAESIGKKLDKIEMILANK